MKRPNNQTGAVLSFLVVGALLVVVTGTVFYVASRNMDDKNVAIDTPSLILPGEDDQSTSSDTNDASTSDKTSDNDSTNTSGDATTNDNQATSTTDTTNNSDTNVDELSQTGPADTAAQIVAIGGLAFAGAAFVRSRRSKTSL